MGAPPRCRRGQHRPRAREPDDPVQGCGAPLSRGGEPRRQREALREMILRSFRSTRGTEKLHADLKKRLAKLGRRQARRPERRPPRRSAHVRREGAGQRVLFGPPNAGKSSLLAALTHAHLEIADYPFTTRAPLPGMMPFEDVQVQPRRHAARRAGPHRAVPAEPRAGRGRRRSRARPDRGRRRGGVRDGARDPLPRPPLRPRARVAPPGASPLLQGRPVLVVATRRDLDDDGTFFGTSPRPSDRTPGCPSRSPPRAATVSTRSGPSSSARSSASASTRRSPGRSRTSESFVLSRRDRARARRARSP